MIYTKKINIILLFFIISPFINALGAQLKFTSIPISGFEEEALAGSIGLQNMFIKIENIDSVPHKLQALTVTFIGGQYIMNDTVGLWCDKDGDFSTTGDNYPLLKGSSISVVDNKTYFSNQIIDALPILATSEDKISHIYVTFSLNSKNLDDKQEIVGFINDPESDIETDCDPSNIVYELSILNKYYIEISAKSYQFNAIGDQTAGVGLVNAWLFAVDNDNNLDSDYTESTYIISDAFASQTGKLPYNIPKNYQFSNGKINFEPVIFYCAQSVVLTATGDVNGNPCLIQSGAFTVEPNNYNPFQLRVELIDNDAVEQIDHVITGVPFKLKIKFLDEWENEFSRIIDTISTAQVSISASGNKAPNALDGRNPQYPIVNNWGTSTVYQSYPILLYAYETNRQLSVLVRSIGHIPAFEIVQTTNEFDVIPNPLGPSTLEITGYPNQVLAGKSFGITVTAYDEYRNVYKGYTKYIRFISSDEKAILPPISLMPEGVISFPRGITLYSANKQQNLIVTETESLFVPLSAETAPISVLPLAEITSFSITTPSEVKAGESFPVSIVSYDTYANISSSEEPMLVSLEQGSFKITSQAPDVSCSVFSLSHTIPLQNGQWSGSVMLDAESLSNSFIVSSGGITFRQGAPFILDIPNPEKDFNYPNPFSSLRGSTTIRYYVFEESSVDIKIYTLTGDIIREWSIDSQQGINLLVWDGADGNGNKVGSGGYLCAIWKKGYHSIWNNGLKNKPIIVKIAVVN